MNTIAVIAATSFLAGMFFSAALTWNDGGFDRPDTFKFWRRKTLELSMRNLLLITQIKCLQAEIKLLKWIGK
jgi:hypothetical protein